MHENYQQARAVQPQNGIFHVIILDDVAGRFFAGQTARVVQD